jgi:hypothetical protein
MASVLKRSWYLANVTIHTFLMALMACGIMAVRVVELALRWKGFDAAVLLREASAMHATTKWIPHGGNTQ